jgi:hypothetical protein
MVYEEGDKTSLSPVEWMYLRIFYEDLKNKLEYLGKKYEIVLDSVEKTLQDIDQHDKKENFKVSRNEGGSGDLF